MRKLILILALFFESISSFAQSESHDFTTYDTIITPGYSGIEWRLRISRPVNYFTPNHADTASRPMIFTIPGQGEMGTNYAMLRTHGPHYWMQNGWDGSVVLGNGTHYPIIISAISNNTWMTGREAAELIARIYYKFHPKNIHAAGLSQGAFALSASLLYPSTTYRDTSSFKIKSLVCLQGASAEVTGGNTQPVSGWGRWAKQFGGKFFGVEGTNDWREVWRVSDAMNDSIPGQAYFSWVADGWQNHCCWNQMYDPSKHDWQNFTPKGAKISTYGNPDTKTMPGTYKNGSSIFQWMLRQGDTTLVGGGGNTPPVANAGSDQTITLPTNSVTLNGSGSTDSDGTITSYAWSKTAGGSATITSPSSVSTTVTGLAAGSYTFRLDVTDNDGGTGYDYISVTVNAEPVNSPPNANAGADQTIYLPTTTATLNGTASNDPDGSITAYAWSKEGGGSATITSASSASTTVTGLSLGSYVFRLIVTDNEGAKDTAYTNVEVANAPTGNNYTWDVNRTNIIISDTSSFGNLNCGDTVFIPVRSGGYRSYSLQQVNSGTLGCYIVVYWMPGAYRTPTNSNNFADYIDSAYWVKTVGMVADEHVDPWRLGTHGYSHGIWFDNCSFNNSSGFGPINTGALPDFAGDTLKTFAHWTFSNCSFIGTKNGGSGAIAILMGGNTLTNRYNFWYKPKIYNCVFKNYPSDGLGSNFIKASKVIGGSFHDLVMDSLGMVAHPTGHASLLNLYAFHGEIYNIKGKGNFGNIIRGKFADYPALGAEFTGRSKIWNILIYDQRKYAMLESQQTDTTGFGGGYVRPRTTPVVWNVTMHRAGVGAGNGAYHAAIVDSYLDSVTIKNSILIQVKDTTWGTVWGPRIFAQSSMPITFADTSNNKLVQNWSSSYFVDSANYIPAEDGYLHNTGTTLPSYITTDINGGIRPYETADIGAVERQPEALPPVADAGGDQTITLPTSSVTLDGSGSTAPSGTIVSYSWTKTEGGSAIITSPSSVSTTVTGLTEGSYVFDLTVTDSNGGTNNDVVTITVNAAPPPYEIRRGWRLLGLKYKAN